MGGPVSSLQHKFIYGLINKLQYLRHYNLLKFGDDLLMTFIPPLNVRTLKTFSIASTILIKALSLLQRNKLMEDYGFLTLYWIKIIETSLYWYTGKNVNQVTPNYSSQHQTSWKESVVSSLFNRVFSIIIGKDNLTKYK